MAVDDRAQVVLVGALALAFLLLGIVVVLNYTVYTESVTSVASVDGTEEVVVFEHEATRGAAGVVYQVNRGYYTNLVNLHTDARNNISAFSAAYANSTARTKPIAGEVTFDLTNSSDGTALREDNFDTVDIVRQGDRQEFVEWVVTVDVSGGGNVEMYVGNGSDWYNVTLTADNVNNMLQVSNGVSCTVAADSSGSVTIDLLAGKTSDGQSCDVANVPDNLDGPYSLEYNNNGIDGEYELVAPTTSLGGTDVSVNDRSYVIWELALELRYDSRTIASQTRREVVVYEVVP